MSLIVFSDDEDQKNEQPAAPEAPAEPQQEEPEEEKDYRTAEEIMVEISQLDLHIVEIRSSKQFPPTEKLEQISELMENRNVLIDELQEVRSHEFHEFVDSLKLNEIRLHPFFPGPKRCKLQVLNEKANDLLKEPLPPKPSLFSKKNTAPLSPIAQLSVQRQEQITRLLEKYNKELKVLSKKKLLSPQETARKLRLECEIKSLEQFDKTQPK